MKNKTTKNAKVTTAVGRDDLIAPRVVLVGTYKGDQLTKWRGWYNYPISEEELNRVERAERVDGRADCPQSAEPRRVKDNAPYQASTTTCGRARLRRFRCDDGNGGDLRGRLPLRDSDRR